MQIGDLVRFKKLLPGKVFLVMKTETETNWNKLSQKVWIYPDPRLKEKASDRWYVPDPSKQADHTDDNNYYYGHYFEVVSESR